MGIFSQKNNFSNVGGKKRKLESQPKPVFIGGMPEAEAKAFAFIWEALLPDELRPKKKKDRKVQLIDIMMQHKHLRKAYQQATVRILLKHNELHPTELEYVEHLIETLRAQRVREISFGDFLEVALGRVKDSPAEDVVVEAFRSFAAPSRLAAPPNHSAKLSRGVSGGAVSSHGEDSHAQSDDAADTTQFIPLDELHRLLHRLGFGLTEKQRYDLIEDLNLSMASPLALSHLGDILDWCNDLRERLEEKERKRKEREEKMGRNLPMRRGQVEKERERKTLAKIREAMLGVRLFLTNMDDPVALGLQECSVCYEMCGVYRPRERVFICPHCVDLLAGRKLKEELSKSNLGAAKPLEARTGDEDGGEPDPDAVIDFDDASHQGLQGASGDFAYNEYSECRICLDPGFRRKCCKEYYCNKCYFKTKYCPGCQQANDPRVIAALTSVEAGTIAVLLGWIVTLFTLLLGLFLPILFIMNDIARVNTVYGHTCYGWFPKCDIVQCIEVGDDFAQGLPSQAEWRHCTLDSKAKAYGTTCIYDREVYFQTNKMLGFDFCRGEQAGLQPAVWRGREYSQGSAFSNGAYVFEDTFEQWVNTTGFEYDSQYLFGIGRYPASLMQSATWGEMYNVKVSSDCGSSRTRSERPSSLRMSDSKALIFVGNDQRYATTRGVDVRNGGVLNFYLRFPPEEGQDATSECKASFFGDLQLSYSIDGGSQYLDWKTFIVADYQQQGFAFVSLDLPADAHTNNTRFRWGQSFFDPTKDNVAIDDVRVFQYFDRRWDQSREFTSKKTKSKEDAAMAACCLESDRCAIEGARSDGTGQQLSSPSFDSCANLPDYVARVQPDDSEPPRLVLAGGRVYVLIALALWLMKGLYGDVLIPLCTEGTRAFLPKFLQPRKGPKITAIDASEDAVNESEKTFKVYVDYEWHRIFAGCTLPFVLLFTMLAFVSVEDITLYYPLHLYRGRPNQYSEYPEVSAAFVVYVAIFLDLHAYYHVARHNICLLPFWVPKVEANTSTKVNTFTTGTQVISLLDVRDVIRYGEKWAKYLGLNYILMVWPWCSISLLIADANWAYKFDYFASRFFGTFICCRVYFGAEMFIKFYWMLEWLFRSDNDARDNLGSAVMSVQGLFWSCVIGFLSAASVSTGMTMGVSGQQLSQDPGFISTCTIIALVLGIYKGTLLAIFMQLPVTPNFKLTRLADGSYIRYSHKRNFAIRLFTFLHTNEAMMVLYVEDMVGLKKALKGGEEGEGD